MIASPAPENPKVDPVFVFLRLPSVANLTLSENDIVAEIENNRAALIRLGAHPQRIFRPPYGDDSFALAEAARKLGVTPIVLDVLCR